jgi:hypothetical protein
MFWIVLAKDPQYKAGQWYRAAYLAASVEAKTGGYTRCLELLELLSETPASKPSESEIAELRKEALDGIRRIQQKYAGKQ